MKILIHLLHYTSGIVDLNFQNYNNIITMLHLCQKWRSGMDVSGDIKRSLIL